jgi:hypothetical protein
MIQVGCGTTGVLGWLGWGGLFCSFLHAVVRLSRRPLASAYRAPIDDGKL